MTLRCEVIARVSEDDRFEQVISLLSKAYNQFLLNRIQIEKIDKDFIALIFQPPNILAPAPVVICFILFSS